MTSGVDRSGAGRGGEGGRGGGRRRRERNKNVSDFTHAAVDVSRGQNYCTLRLSFPKTTIRPVHPIYTADDVRGDPRSRFTRTTGYTYLTKNKSRTHTGRENARTRDSSL